MEEKEITLLVLSFSENKVKIFYLIKSGVTHQKYFLLYYFLAFQSHSVYFFSVNNLTYNLTLTSNFKSNVEDNLLKKFEGLIDEWKIY